MHNDIFDGLFCAKPFSRLIVLLLLKHHADQRNTSKSGTTRWADEVTGTARGRANARTAKGIRQHTIPSLFCRHLERQWPVPEPHGIPRTVADDLRAEARVLHHWISSIERQFVFWSLLSIFFRSLMDPTIDWLNVRMIDWLIDWLIDWWMDWTIEWLIDWLIDWLIEWLIDWLIDWLIEWMFCWYLYDPFDFFPGIGSG